MPTLGLEGFERRWSGNESAKFSFGQNDLVAGDFDRTALGVHDLLTETFTDGAAVPAGVKPPFLVVRVAAPGTADNAANPPPLVPPPIYTLAVTNAGGPATINVAIAARVAEGVEYNLSVGAGTLSNLTNFSTGTGTKLTGTLQFFAPAQLLENFEDAWPAPTSGML